MYDLVTFGEMLLRLGAPSFQKIEQANWFNIGITGGEMNTCTVASRFGLKTAHITKLPRNPLGRMVINKIREQGIDTSHIVWSEGGRVGLFYLEFGAMPRVNSVIYDRANSTMSEIKPGEVNWNSIFKGAKVFHVCGTLPALSDTAAKATKEALIAAKNKNVEVSFDLNYRAKLWSEEKAQEVLAPLMKYCDILITTEEDSYRVFKIKEDNHKLTAKKLHEEFGFKVVVITLRGNITVLRNNWSAIAYSDNQFYDDLTYEIELIDRVGGGDAFTGGFLYAYIKFDKDIKKCLKYGNASSALKQTIPGDLNWSTIEEVEELIKRGSGDGIKLRISR